MSFLLDTNICTSHLKRPGGLAHRMIQYSGRLYMPTVVLGELFAWAYCRIDPSKLLQQIEDELLAFSRLPPSIFSVPSPTLLRANRLKAAETAAILKTPVDQPAGDERCIASSPFFEGRS
jgi:tRNA(fMet)-specific endonuclease VapC